MPPATFIDFTGGTDALSQRQKSESHGSKQTQSFAFLGASVSRRFSDVLSVAVKFHPGTSLKDAQRGTCVSTIFAWT